MSVVTWQKVESIAIAVAVLAATIMFGTWWWLFVLFLAFDLSALGYLAGPRIGSVLYNAVHSYIGPSIVLAWLAGIALLGWGGDSAPTTFLIVLGSAWIFHVAVDRALGYGLKHPDAFQHTHLGWIGKRPRDADASE